MPFLNIQNKDIVFLKRGGIAMKYIRLIIVAFTFLTFISDTIKSESINKSTYYCDFDDEEFPEIII